MTYPPAVMPDSAGVSALVGPGPEAAQAVRRAAVRATLAPSVNNTQPWRLRLHPTALEIHSDWERRLPLLDPRGRQLIVSCGCAVFNARVSLAAGGFDVDVERFPDATRPDFIARLTVRGRRVPEPLGALDGVIEARHTNRQPFADEATSARDVRVLVAAAAAEGVTVLPITDPGHRLAAAQLSREAESVPPTNAPYAAELRAWTANQCLLLLGTAQDTPASWLRTGEALERVLLEVTRLGLAASPVIRLVDQPAMNAGLRRQLGLTLHPQVLLRVGQAPATPASRRRRFVDMLELSP